MGIFNRTYDEAVRMTDGLARYIVSGRCSGTREIKFRNLSGEQYKKLARMLISLQECEDDDYTVARHLMEAVDAMDPD